MPDLTLPNTTMLGLLERFHLRVVEPRLATAVVHAVNPNMLQAYTRATSQSTWTDFWVITPGSLWHHTNRNGDDMEVYAAHHWVDSITYWTTREELCNMLTELLM